MTSNKTYVAERAKRRDAAIEKYKNEFLRLTLEHEHNFEELNAFSHELRKFFINLSSLNDNLNLSIVFAPPDTKQPEIIEKTRREISKLVYEGKNLDLDDLRWNMNTHMHDFDKILAWLETDSKNSHTRVDHIANSLKIPIDKSDKLWPQKTIAKINKLRNSNQNE